MDRYDAKSASILPLGKQGENLAKQIQFDLSGWIGSFGPGTVQLLHQRKGDEAPYPVAVEQEGERAIWTVTSADTASAGTGRAELQYYVGDALAKSETWMTRVLPALGTAGETPPEAQQGWVDQVLQAGAEVSKAASAAIHQPIVGSNGNWWTWDLDAGAYVDTGIYSGGDAPFIGENGNWFVGRTDTGVSATGPAGPALAVANTAAVGQTVKITAVDEAGQPTEWEAVAFPSDGNNVTKTLLFDGSAATDTTVTLSESFQNFDFLLMVCYISGNKSYPYLSVIDCGSIQIGPYNVCYGTTALESASKFNSCGFAFPSVTSINFNSKAEGWGAGTLGRVYGIKL